MDLPIALDLEAAEPLPEATQRYFDKCRDKLGLVPNVLLAYAHDIDKLNAFAAFYNDLMLGASGLSKLEREMIAVAVSAENRCFYCLVAHGAAVRELSGDPALGEMMAMNYRVAPLEPRQRAMLDFAVKVTRVSAEISEADRAALRGHGFGERDIWDIAAWRRSSTCRTAWRAPSTCAPTLSITRGPGSAAGRGTLSDDGRRGIGPA